MSWSNIYTKFKAYLETQSFEEAKEIFSFDHTPDIDISKVFELIPGTLIDPKENKDANLEYWHTRTATILICYKTNAFEGVSVLAEIASDQDAISYALEQPANFPTGVALVKFKNATSKPLGTRTPDYIVSEINFDCMYTVN